MENKNDAALKLVKQFCPGYRVSSKSKSWIHRAIGWILGKLGNKEYMTRYYTTIGQNTAVPDGVELEWEVVLHEGRHAIDSKRMGNVLFGLLYLLPQSLALVALLVGALVACGGPLWLLWGLVSLICLAPLPALGRAWAELRAYRVSVAVAFWAKKTANWDKVIKALEGIFAGPGYYYMLPCKTFVRWYFRRVVKQLQTNTLDLDAYLAACKTLAIE